MMIEGAILVRGEYVIDGGDGGDNDDDGSDDNDEDDDDDDAGDADTCGECFAPLCYHLFDSSEASSRTTDRQ